MLSRSFALLFVLSLAACGGGSGSGSPVALPSVAPTKAPTAYTLTLHTTGGSTGPNGVTTASYLRVPMAGAAYAEFAAPDTTSVSYGFPSGTFDTTVTVQAVVSPQPSSTPSATFNTTAANVVPQNTHPLDSNFAATAVQTESAGDITAQVTSLGLTQTQHIIVNRRITIGCNSKVTGIPQYDGEYNGGVVIAADGTASFVTDPALADVAIKGPNCQGLFKDATLTQNVLVCPHGCLALDETHDFAAIASADFLYAVGQYNTSYFTSQPVAVHNLVIKTGQNKTIKWRPTMLAPGDTGNTPAQFSGGYCQLGLCRDGTT